MEERNRGLRTASHLALLLRKRNARYVTKRAMPSDLTTADRNAAAAFLLRRARMETGLRVTQAR
jgi:hypothetical protein